MIEILSEVGKRLLDRWMTLLVLPGLLFVAAAVAAARLGHAHALDVQALSTWITAQLDAKRSPGAGAVLLVVASVLLAAAAAGLCATALARLTAYLWTLPGHITPLRWLTDRRRDRWKTADDTVAAAIGAAVTGTHPKGVGAALAARDRIALTEPAHPTWIGDRLTAPATRVEARYGLDLAAAWPRLWLIVPDATRAELTAAHDAYMASARLAGWTVIYTALALVWWPAALIATVLAVSTHIQSRAAATTLADLTEATVDLYGTDLAAQLHITHTGELTPDAGFAITAALRKDLLPATHPTPSLADRKNTTPAA